LRAANQRGGHGVQNMERINEDAGALIDLGAASVETQGFEGTVIDLVGMQPKAGLSDED